VLEDAELLPRQGQRRTVPTGTVTSPVDHEVTALNERRRSRPAPGQRANPRDELMKREGLPEVVISTEFKTVDAIIDGARCGEH
jgi:hypothetical protein